MKPRAQFSLMQTSRPVNNIRVSKSNTTFTNPSLIMCNNWKLFFKSYFNNRRRHNHPFITRTTATPITITITVFLVATTTVNFGSSSSFFVSLVYPGGGVAEWSGRWICNVVVPGSSPPPCYSLDQFFSVAPSSTPWLRFVNSQLVCLLPVGIFNHFRFIYNVCFYLFVLALKNPIGGVVN